MSGYSKGGGPPDKNTISEIILKINKVYTYYNYDEIGRNLIFLSAEKVSPDEDDSRNAPEIQSDSLKIFVIVTDQYDSSVRAVLREKLYPPHEKVCLSKQITVEMLPEIVQKTFSLNSPPAFNNPRFFP